MEIRLEHVTVGELVAGYSDKGGATPEEVAQALTRPHGDTGI